MKVLMIDDDEELCKMLQEYFSLENILLDYCLTGNSWPVMTKKRDYDVIILDLSLPNKNGLIILKQLVSNTTIPVVLLTAQGSDVDHLTSLGIGAEDYIDKPCNPPILIARLKKIIERKQQNPKLNQTKVSSCGPLTIDFSTRKAQIDLIEVKLTSSQFRIMEVLISNPGKYFTKEEISLAALGRKPTAYDRSLEAQIHKLRKKIGVASNNQVEIQNQYGFGYKLISHA